LKFFGQWRMSYRNAKVRNMPLITADLSLSLSVPN